MFYLDGSRREDTAFRWFLNDNLIFVDKLLSHMYWDRTRKFPVAIFVGQNLVFLEAGTENTEHDVILRDMIVIEDDEECYINRTSWSRFCDVTKHDPTTIPRQICLYSLSK